MQRQKDKSPFAIIVGLATIQGLQAARILARHKVPIIAIANDLKHFSCRTNVCREIHLADTKSEDFVRLLETIGPRLKSKAVLVPCRDESVLQLSRNRHRLTDWYHFLLPAQETVEMLIDKNRFYQFAKENHYPIPATYTVKDRPGLVAISKDLRFPCIFKPPYRNEVWAKNSAFKAFKVNSRVELLALYESCKGWHESFVVQEWIEGSDHDLYTCNCYLNARSEPLVTFVSRKIRQWQPETGEASLAQECRNDEVLSETLRLFKCVNFMGLGYLEMKHDKRSGRYYIIEPNICRPTGRSSMAEAGGVELLYSMYCDLLGLPLPVNREQKYTNIKWVHLTRDCVSALHYWSKGQLTFRSWLRTLRGKKVFAVLSLSDPIPFCADVYRALRLLLLREAQQRRNFASFTKPLSESSRGDLNRAGTTNGEYEKF